MDNVFNKKTEYNEHYDDMYIAKIFMKMWGALRHLIFLKKIYVFPIEAIA